MTRRSLGAESWISSFGSLWIIAAQRTKQQFKCLIGCKPRSHFVLSYDRRGVTKNVPLSVGVCAPWVQESPLNMFQSHNVQIVYYILLRQYFRYQANLR